MWKGSSREELFNKLVSGQQTVTSGTKIGLVSSGVFVDYVSVKAHFENTDVVFIGPSGTEKYHLNPDDSLDIGLSNLIDISLDANTGTQKVAFLGGRL